MNIIIKEKLLGYVRLLRAYMVRKFITAPKLLNTILDLAVWNSPVRIHIYIELLQFLDIKCLKLTVRLASVEHTY